MSATWGLRSRFSSPGGPAVQHSTPGSLAIRLPATCMVTPRLRLRFLTFVMVALGGMVASAGCLSTSCTAISSGTSNSAAMVSSLALTVFGAISSRAGWLLTRRLTTSVPRPRRSAHWSTTAPRYPNMTKAPGSCTSRLRHSAGCLPSLELNAVRASRMVLGAMTSRAGWLADRVRSSSIGTPNATDSPSSRDASVAVVMSYRRAGWAARILRACWRLTPRKGPITSSALATLPTCVASIMGCCATTSSTASSSTSSTAARVSRLLPSTSAGTATRPSDLHTRSSRRDSGTPMVEARPFMPSTSSRGSSTRTTGMRATSSRADSVGSAREEQIWGTVTVICLGLMTHSMACLPASSTTLDMGSASRVDSTSNLSLTSAGVLMFQMTGWHTSRSSTAGRPTPSSEARGCSLAATSSGLLLHTAGTLPSSLATLGSPTPSSSAMALSLDRASSGGDATTAGLLASSRLITSSGSSGRAAQKARSWAAA
mmetsp:Transcript_33231/g.73487  ORF Transcript_33231/g.73487 Transcript_33231/m.73487 type:complete len:486 (+) Transcript_33231:1789-3246(+)